MKHRMTFKIVMLVVALSLFCAFCIITGTLATVNVHEINNFDELVEAARLSRTNGYQKDKYVLKNNIEITENDQKKIVESDFKYISFGSSDYPFEGTFDGNGYYISNLKYESTLDPKYDTGLFSYTANGAIIKNLTIKNADIQSDYRGGIIVGHAEGTLFDNVTVEDSHLFVASVNNVVNLITDGGIRGGAIIGEAKDCIVYNCEVKNTIVNTNSTAGLSALSGKGLFLGGLVGTSIATEIEYSRVIGGQVKNYYDVAVGALGGNTLYVGGIVGQMKDGSKVIDCYSTANLYYYCATYVSVGAGNSGHIGGIAAAMYGERNEIQRSHYAGNATSRQYNAVLVIPVIQNNVNISGIADVYEGGSVVSTYFKSSASPNTDMKVLGNNTSTSSYGPLTDERYENQDYWQTKDFDFYGNIKRQTEYNDNHTNKWVMDHETGMPIHGYSISATFDFPNAAKVTISESKLVKTSVKTENSYEFAVQGIKTTENEISKISTEEKEGYRFISWYKVPKVTAWSVEDNSYYKMIFNAYDPISNKKELNNISVQNNDLYIAHYQAKVLFHDINGNIIDISTGKTKSGVDESDWYDYGTQIIEIVPVNNPKSENAKLIGWTTTKSTEEGGGYSSITSPELISLKNNNDFYEVGDEITKTMNLYPVYADLISNVNTVFEGNDLDTVDNLTLRENIGYTAVEFDENDIVTISAIGYEENGNFKDGYRFKGWYDENGYCVSNSATYKLEGIDLTQTHTYTAKLEYRVDYYGTTTKFYDSSDFDGNPFKKPYAQIWYGYEDIFKDMSGTLVLDQGDEFVGWYQGVPSIPHSDSDYGSCKAIASTKKIVESFAAHAHVSGSSNYEIYITSDFPGAGTLSHRNLPSGIDFKVSVTNIPEGYNFLFWACSRDNGNRQETSTSPEDFDSGGVFYTGADYGYEAHFDANVTFYNKESQATTVTRRYNEPVFSENSITYQYTWPIEASNMNITVDNKNVANGIHTSAAFPYNLKDESMKVYGYKFIGWLDKASVTAKEWDYIYGTTGENYSIGEDAYVSSSIDIAAPYLLSSSAICTEPMNIYPVYVKYNIITQVNVTYGNSDLNINIPSNPTYVLGDDLVTITPDLNTYVVGSSGEKYRLTSLVRVLEDGKEETVNLDENNKYKYIIEAGPTYTFMAKYEPLVLVYHLNGSDAEVVIRNSGDAIGNMPLPTYTLSDLSQKHIFKGWTNIKPTGKGYYEFNTNNEFKDSNVILKNSLELVNESMELWPVYINRQIEVNSNIDNYLNNNNIELSDVRYITRPSIDKSQLNAKNEDLGDYEFLGWYKNYKSLDDMGDIITKNTTYVLESEECLEDVVYTAVYREVYQINYFNTRGEIIYTANAYQNETRTFVDDIEDESGNTITVPIDYEAYNYIYEDLEFNEIFKNWQWKKNDETIVEWNDFYNKNINQNMNIYPIINKIIVKDPSENILDDEKIIIGMKQNDIYVCLDEEYNQAKLSVHVEENSFKGNETYDTINLKDENILVYASVDIQKNTIGTAVTDENGDATIYLYGEIKISRENTKEDAKDDIFIFEILDKDNKVINEIIISQNNNKIIKIPYGHYTIRPKVKWSWRYNELNQKINVSNKNDEINIIFDGDRITNKWFDGMTYLDNLYN